MATLTATSIGSSFPHLSRAHAGDETIDLVALAKRVRPCVVLLRTRDSRDAPVATATGFLVSADGRILTNSHVLMGASRVTAKLADGAELDVDGVLGDNPGADLVVLKVAGDAFPFLKLASDIPPAAGTRVVVIGNPLGLEATVSEGIVSAIREEEGAPTLLQISAPISSGSSGSPVVTADGLVVGVARATIKGGQALNLAVPARTAAILLAGLSNQVLPIDAFAGVPLTEAAALLASKEWKAVQSAWGRGADWLEAARALVGAYPESAYAHEVYGEALASLRLLDGALRELGRAIEFDPTRVQTWVRLAQTRTAAVDLPGAEAAAREALRLAATQRRLGPESGIDVKRASPIAQASIVLSDTLLKQERWLDALEVLRGLTKLMPEDSDAWTMLSLAFSFWTYSDVARGSREDPRLTPVLRTEWREAAERAVALDPLNAEAWGEVLTVRRRDGQFRHAAAAFSTLYTIAQGERGQERDRHLASLDLRTNAEGRMQPSNPPFTWFALGEHHRNSGDCESASAAFRLATSPLQAKYPIAESWFGLGDCACRLGRFDEGVRAYGEYAKMRPTEPAAWQRLALALGHSRRLSEAQSASARLRQLNPAMANDIDAWLRGLSK